MSRNTIGMWMYKNGGGSEIERKMIKKLNERDIRVIPELNLRDGVARNGQIICKDVVMEDLDLYFSYNAGEQTQYQVYLYKTLNKFIPIINNYESFSITEDKFRTAHLLRRNGIKTPEFKLCHRDDTCSLKNALKEWGGKMIYKPTEGWGGIGLSKIDNEAGLDMIIPFLNQTNIRYFYVEKFVKNDFTDYRIDIVDGEYIECYGRKAAKNSWKTNITSGGSVILREANDEIIELAKKAAKITGLEIAGVDILYDREKEEYVVIEVNGIPAFATPDQEELGLKFNDKKIDAIVNLVEKKIKEKNNG